MDRALWYGGSSKVKDSWESENHLKFDKDYPYGYTWPPRYYTCSFCQREFKSAQALGGHMNIHRRDRARLRDLSISNNPSFSSNSDQNPNPNPNPNSDPNPIISFSSSSSTTNNIYGQQYSLVALSLSSIPPPTKDGGIWNYESTVEDQEVRVLKKNATSTKDVMRLDLELCLGEAKEDLDLELRLGI